MARGGTGNLQDRIRASVIVTDECWIWQLSTRGNGYGQIKLSNPRRQASAHRASYEAFKGDIPKGLVIEHICETPICVNPAHLSAVTQKTNLKRAKGALATINRSKTHCINGHKFTLANTRIMRDGSRECKTCRIETKRRWRIRHGTRG